MEWALIVVHNHLRRLMQLGTSGIVRVHKSPPPVSAECRSSRVVHCSDPAVPTDPSLADRSRWVAGRAEGSHFCDGRSSAGGVVARQFAPEAPDGSMQSGGCASVELSRRRRSQAAWRYLLTGEHRANRNACEEHPRSPVPKISSLHSSAGQVLQKGSPTPTSTCSGRCSKNIEDLRRMGIADLPAFELRHS